MDVTNQKKRQIAFFLFYIIILYYELYLLRLFQKRSMYDLS